MKRVLIWSSTLILTFGLLVTASRTIGGSIKSSKPTVAEMLAADSYLGPHGWCWRDICPGQTLTANAGLLVRDFSGDLTMQVVPDGPSPGFTWTSIADPMFHGTITDTDSMDLLKPVERININLPNGPSYDANTSMRLRDAIDLFGYPIGIGSRWGGCYYTNNFTAYWWEVFFPNGLRTIVFSDSETSIGKPRITLDLEVGVLDYFDTENLPKLGLGTWRGFTWLPMEAFEPFVAWCPGLE